MIYFQPPIYHTLLVDTIKIGNKEMFIFRSDNSLILHQENLQSYTDKQLENLLTPSSKPSMPYMSDDDLFLACKSRRIQTASELKQWSDFLEDMLNHIKDQAKKSRDKKTDNKPEEPKENKS